MNKNEMYAINIGCSRCYLCDENTDLNIIEDVLINLIALSTDKICVIAPSFHICKFIANNIKEKLEKNNPEYTTRSNTDFIELNKLGRIIFLPINSPEKARGLRVQKIIVINSQDLNKEHEENLITILQGFLAISASPIESIKNAVK